MARYQTLKLDDAEKALFDAGVEPIIHDGKLAALKVGALRIGPSAGKDLFVSQEVEGGA